MNYGTQAPARYQKFLRHSLSQCIRPILTNDARLAKLSSQYFTYSVTDHCAPVAFTKATGGVGSGVDPKI